MPSAVISASAALGRPFVLDEETNAEARPFPSAHKKPAGIEPDIAQGVQSTIKNQQSTIFSIGDRKSAIGNSLCVIPASRLEIRPAPEMVSSGIPAIDALTGGLPRGCLTEICGPASSGRTTLLLAALAAATRRGEFCALVDASDALDPQSVAAAGVELDRLLWVRCGESSPQRHRDTEKNFLEVKPEDRIPSRRANQSEYRLEQALRATDLLLEGGGFRLVVLDLADLPFQAARRIPLTTWFRFRRAVEHTPTVLLAIAQQSLAGNCSSLRLQLGAPSDSSEARKRKQSDSSREAAAGESPARQCRVSIEKGTESRRACPEQAQRAEGDGTTTDGAAVAHPSHAHLLTGREINAELICSRLERKPVRSITFTTKAAWTG